MNATIALASRRSATARRLLSGTSTRGSLWFRLRTNFRGETRFSKRINGLLYLSVSSAETPVSLLGEVF